MKKLTILALSTFTAVALLFTACDKPTDNNTPSSEEKKEEEKKEEEKVEVATITIGNCTITTSKDNENTIAVDETNKTITLTPAEEKVEYTITGSYEGQIINKTKNTVIILSNAAITNTTGIAAIYGELKTEIKAEKDTENTITVSGTPADKKAKFGAVLCEKAVEIGGSGKLTVTCECEKGHGIKASTVELKGSGTFIFDGGSDASAANCNEFVVEAEKTFTATFKDSKNGIKADETIKIASGTFIFDNISKVALKTDTSADDKEGEVKEHGITLDAGTFTFTDTCAKPYYSTEADKFTKASTVIGEF